MVKESVKSEIKKRLDELCESHGLPCNLDLVDFWDNQVNVPIPNAIANEKPESVEEVCEELRKLEFIESIWHEGKGRVLKSLDKSEFEISVKDGYWKHTKEDDVAEAREMRKLFDMDFAKKEKERKEAEKRKYWKEYILPLPKTEDNGVTDVYLAMAYEPYDWIKNGEKDTEFRAYNEYYAKKLFSHPVRTVRFQRGYGGPGRPKPEQMTWEVKSITLYDSQSKLECPPDRLVEGIIPTFFAINLGRRIC